MQSGLLPAERASMLAELYLLLTDGPLHFVPEDAGVPPDGLDRALVESVRLRPLSEPIVYRALAHAARASPPRRFAVLRLLAESMSADDSPFAERYEAAVALMELWLADRTLFDLAWLQRLLVRLGLASEHTLLPDATAQMLLWAHALGAHDRKKIQHRHLYLACALDPSVAHWGALFPFLLGRPKSATGTAFVSVWHCEQDPPGMHMRYKAAYARALLHWLAADCAPGLAAEHYLVACRKVCAHLHEMVRPQDVLRGALDGLRVLAGRLDAYKDAQAVLALLRKHCDDAALVQDVASALGLA
jgi:hypothetical protein